MQLLIKITSNNDNKNDKIIQDDDKNKNMKNILMVGKLCILQVAISERRKVDRLSCVAYTYKTYFHVKNYCITKLMTFPDMTFCLQKILF